jgi:hypothetical protein
MRLQKLKQRLPREDSQWLARWGVGIDTDFLLKNAIIGGIP